MSNPAGPSETPSRGRLIVISAPSGAGKSTIARAVLKAFPQMLFSVSATTRPARPNEINGREYYFLSKEEFEEKIQAGDLVEWEEIYGNYYGTLKAEIERTIAAGRVMLFDIDVKGALSIKRQFPDQSVLIFIQPPSVEVLRERLERRRTESADVLARRMERVPMELAQAEHFTHRVVNDELRRATLEVFEIVQSVTHLHPTAVSPS
jgi:guanylate kinase